MQSVAKEETKRPFAESEVMQSLLVMMRKISAEPDNTARAAEVVPSVEVVPKVETIPVVVDTEEVVVTRAEPKPGFFKRVKRGVSKAFSWLKRVVGVT